MSAFVYAAPEELAAASSSLSSLESSIREAHAASAGLTTSIAAAAEDEVSAAVAKLFGGYAQQFQALGAQASLFHDQFVQALNGGGFLYAATEATSASPLRPWGCKTPSMRRSCSSPGARWLGRVPMGRRAPGRPVGPVDGCGAMAAMADRARRVRPPTRPVARAGPVGRRSCSAPAVTVDPAGPPMRAAARSAGPEATVVPVG